MSDTRPHFFNWDERRDIAHIGTEGATVNFAVEHFISCGKEAIHKWGNFIVALSGGSTPKKIYQQLSTPPFATAIDWTKVLLFWSDERAVPPTNSESNFRMAMDAGLKTLSIPTEQIFRMEGERDAREAARDYQKKIDEVLGRRPFDLIMLGMGEDGHTASLFPGTEALVEKEALVVANPVPQKACTRLTLTLPCINRASNIVVYVMGASKAPTLKEAFLKKKQPPLPISLVGTDDSKALFILDDAAAAPLLKEEH